MLKRFLKNTTRSNLTTSKFIFFGLLSLTLTACSKEEVKVKPPAPAVSVYSIKSQSIGGYREFVARTEASKEADLRARVEGELLERHFRDVRVHQILEGTNEIMRVIIARRLLDQDANSIL